MFPQERVNINDAYPHFEDYRRWLTGETDTLTPEAEFWYQAPSTDPGLLYQPE